MDIEDLRQAIIDLTRFVYELEYRNRALEELLTEKGIVSPEEITERAEKVQASIRTEANQVYEAEQMEKLLDERREQ